MNQYVQILHSNEYEVYFSRHLVIEWDQTGEPLLEDYGCGADLITASELQRRCYWRPEQVPANGGWRLTELTTDASGTRKWVSR